LLNAIDVGKYTLKQFVPFWIRGAVKAAQSEGGLGKTLSKSPGKLIAPEFGIMPATRKYTMTPFEKAAYEDMKNRLPVGSRTKEQADKSKLKREIESSLRRNDKDAPEKAIEALHQGLLAKKDIKTIFKRLGMTPIEKMTKTMSVDTLAKIIDKATDEEKKELAQIFKKKFQNKRGELDIETQMKYAAILKELNKYRAKPAEMPKPPNLNQPTRSKYPKSVYVPKNLRTATQLSNK
jgi:hypothetical protein